MPYAPPRDADNARPHPPEDEVLFLTLHHLHIYDADPAVAAALRKLEDAFKAINKLPIITDYTGSSHVQTYAQLAARNSHIPSTYLRDLLRTRLPTGRNAPNTLLAKGRFSTSPSKRPRARRIQSVKARLSPVSSNVATLVDQQSFLPTQPRVDRLTFALLPKAFRRLKRLVGHHLPVYTTIFDHTARLIVTGSDDHLVKIWSAETGYLQHTLRGHDSDITEIVKHPTRPIIISASSDTTLRVWDVNTGAALHVLDGGSKEVNAVQFSPCPDRPYLVSGGADGSVRLWNGDAFEAGFLRIPIPNRFVMRHATDTRHAGAAATSRAAPASPVNDAAPSPTAHIVPLNSNQPASQAPQNLVQSVPHASANSVPAGSIQATASGQAPARETPRHAANSVVSGTPIYEVLSVCFNAGATRLAVSGTDCIAHVYAVEKAETPDSPFPQIRLLTSLKGHSEHIIQVLFSRSGGSIVTACRDGTARIWNRTKARLPGARTKKQSVVGMGSWSSKVLDCRSQIQADARSILSGGASGSACGSIVPRMRRASFPVSVCAAMWSRNDRYLFTASTDTKIRIWDGETGQLARVLEAHESEVYVMDCHPTDERILLSAGYDGRCILWDIETGAQLRTFSISNQSGDEGPMSGPDLSGKRPSVVDGQFSCDGLSFVVSDTSGAITLFGVGSGEATALAPEEQFFSNDCTPFRRDSQNRALDENAGLLLHLVPKGRLCDSELRPHPPELQPNVPFLTSLIASGKKRDEIKAKQPSSPNTVENKNRDALLQRAKEFRENQEKEERRLLREARNARRRMIIERERASLQTDKQCFLPLRDFEVPDSDYEDSDEDFDGDAYVSVDSDSSSSSDEEEIQPARKRRSTRTAVKGTREEGRLLQKVTKRRRESLRRSRKEGEEDSNTVESGDSEDGAESPGYIGNSDSESENSESVMEDGEQEQRRRVVTEQARISDFNKEPRISDGQISVRGPSPTRGIASPPRGLQLSRPSGIALVGASMSRATRRMKININGKGQSARPAQTAASTPAGAIHVAAEAKSPTDPLAGQMPLNGAQSVGSYHGQEQPSDGAAMTGVQTPMNPSFTSERKHDINRSQRTFKPIEDHQGDTASCFRPRRVIEELDDRNQPSPHDRMAVQYSSVVRSPETQKGQHYHTETDLKLDISKTLNSISRVNIKADGLEKSLLSDSPARTTKKRWRSRTRNGSVRIENPEENDPVIDIDELAERELEILEAERSRRRRRRRKRQFSQDSSEGEHTAEDGDKRFKRGEKEDGSDGGKRQRKRNSRGDGLHDFLNIPAFDNQVASPSLKGSNWLRSTTSKHTYVPQLGDDVMYFPEGHATAMEVSKSVGLDPLVDKAYYKKHGKEVLDGTTFAKDPTPLRLNIIDVSYDFPVAYASNNKSSKGKGGRGMSEQTAVKSKTMVILTFRLLSGYSPVTGGKRIGQGDRFILPYFPVDAPEYLVLTSRVESALNRSWKAADRFRILFLNERRAWQYYMGTIRNVKPTAKSVMWNTIEVEYDLTDTEKDKVSTDLVSPWELEPLDLFQGSRDMVSQYPQLIRSSTVEPGLFPIIARELEAIRQMESTWRAQLSWLDSVDTLAATEGYCSTVPFPMDLDTVLVRMCTGYYRHFCSFLHDISLLKNNAIRFHGPQSEKGLLAVNVFTRIAETSERIRGQFLASIMSVPHAAPYHGQQLGTQAASRAIRPRPTQGEASGSVGAVSGQHGTSTPGRQFPVPLTPRQASVAFAAPPNLGNDSSGHHMMAPTHSPRVWNGLRLYPGAAQQGMVYANASLGIALPPVLPGMSASGATTRGGRSTRGSGRAQGIRQNNAQARRGNAGTLNRGHVSSPTLAATPASLAAATFPHGMPHSFLPPHVNPGQYQQPQVRMVANSSQTNNNAGRGGARRLAPSGSLSQPRTSARPLTQSSGPLPVASVPVGDNGLVTSVKGYASNGVCSPQQDGGMMAGGVAAVSVTQPSPQGGPPRPGRAASTAGDGGTHSWGRSMEGAGGIFPLQASTSDSHLPVPGQGRSQSPISPTPGAGDAANAAMRQQASSVMANGAPAYHEHSTISIAAAESTMSCGGAELQAATAESADVASERPKRTR